MRGLNARSPFLFEMSLFMLRSYIFFTNFPQFLQKKAKLKKKSLSAFLLFQKKSVSLHVKLQKKDNNT